MQYTYTQMHFFSPTPRFPFRRRESRFILYVGFMQVAMPPSSPRGRCSTDGIQVTTSTQHFSTFSFLAATDRPSFKIHHVQQLHAHAKENKDDAGALFRTTTSLVRSCSLVLIASTARPPLSPLLTFK